MSIFIKIEKNDLRDMSEKIKILKNSLIDLNSSTINARQEIKEKKILLQQARVFVNESHEEIIKILNLMPEIRNGPLKIHGEINFDSIKVNPQNHQDSLKKLNEKISGLR